MNLFVLVFILSVFHHNYNSRVVFFSPIFLLNAYTHGTFWWPFYMSFTITLFPRLLGCSPLLSTEYLLCVFRHFWLLFPTNFFPVLSNTMSEIVMRWYFKEGQKKTEITSIEVKQAQYALPSDCKLCYEGSLVWNSANDRGSSFGEDM